VNNWFNTFAQKASPNSAGTSRLLLARRTKESLASFANEGQFLIMSQESVDELNRQMEARAKSKSSPSPTQANKVQKKKKHQRLVMAKCSKIEHLCFV